MKAATQAPAGGIGQAAGAALNEHATQRVHATRSAHAAMPSHADMPQSPPGPFKAAAILNVLDAPLLERLAQHFTPEDFARIRELQLDPAQVRSLELEAVVEDFARQFIERLRTVGDLRPPAALLEEVLGAEDLQRLSEPEEAEELPPVWDDERFASEEVLLPLAESEHPQVVAFIFTRIDSELSARVMQRLELHLRNDILMRLLDMRPVAEEMTLLVEQQIRIGWIDNASAGRNAEARARIAEIVNRMDREEAERFLQQLKAVRPEEAREIARMLFSFEDIVRLSEQDRLLLFDRVPTELTVKALHGAPQELVDMVLAALGGRMRKMVEAELSGGVAPPEEETLEARRQIAAIALQMAQDGEIVIHADDDA